MGTGVLSGVIVIAVEVSDLKINPLLVSHPSFSFSSFNYNIFNLKFEFEINLNMSNVINESVFAPTALKIA
jgi:hypothetical protein